MVRVKSEPDHDDQGSQPSASGSNPRPYQPPWKAGISGMEASSSTSKPQAPSPTKRRRVTISGINTDVKRPSSSDANTPISPVVIGFNLAREDSAAIEQVRSMLNVKLQQKALIEQRRNSTAGLTSPMVNTTPTIHIANVNGSDARVSNSRRHSMVLVHREPTLPHPPRNPSPPPSFSQSHQPSQTPTQTQPPPPPPPTQAPSHEISLARQPDGFGRRRASRPGVKSKPADILISPRETNNDQIPTSIMSAPAHNSKFSMALPSLPPAMAGQAAPRVTSSIVPPTPTRLGGPRTAIPNLGPTNPTNRRSPNHQVPISSNLISQTPLSLKFNSSEKNAFLAPFEKFYDSLADSKQLKDWLGQQLQKSNTLVSALQKSEKLEEVVEAMVEKRMAPMREEMYGLHRRVEELEHALKISSSQGPGSASVSQSSSTSYGKGKGRGPEPMAVEAAESYTFPPQSAPSEVRLSAKSDLVGRKLSPSDSPNSQSGSPAPFHEGRRLSVSSVRFERRLSPPPTVERSQSHGAVPSHLSPGPSGPRSSRSPINTKMPLPKPEAQRHHSYPSPSSEAQQPRSYPKRKSLATGDRRRELRDLVEESNGSGSRSNPLLSPSHGTRETREEGGLGGRRELISVVSQRSRRYSSSSEDAP